MKTAYMGLGKIVTSSFSHKKVDGKLIVFSKAKHSFPINPITENVSRKDIGKGLFQIYFPNKESLKRLIDYMQMIYDEWEGER